MANANQIITVITKSSDQITAAIANSSNQIAAVITNSNPFWQQVLAGSIGAFAGAGAAFLFNWRNELRKIRHEQNTAINETIHLFSLNIMMLLNFKHQFLEKFSDELGTIAEHAGGYHSKLPHQILEKLAEQWETEHKPMIEKCFKEYKDDMYYAGLNGFLKKWELVKYAKVDLKQIYFVTEGMPDTLQFALFANQQIELFADLLKQRNEFWKEKISILSGDQLGEPTPAFMCCLYEFICMRQNLRVYLDQAVVMMRATNICLAKYQENHFPRRRKLMKWMFGDYTWIRGVLPKEIKELMPMPRTEGKKQFIGTYPEQYFGGSFDVIKANWWPEQPAKIDTAAKK